MAKKTYEQINAEIAELEAQRDQQIEALNAKFATKLETLRGLALEARNEEAASKLEAIRADIKAFGFTDKELFGKARGAKSLQRKVTPRKKRDEPVPKYRNPETGATWTGMGRAPNWIKEAANREDFKI